MAEPRRAESPLPEDASVDRASQADALLVQGLDLYFNGRFEDAIHLWTRVLFLDRTHARARAYIDRARSALAERQRRSEELLQASQQLLERGETGQARDLLTAVVAATGDDERAAAVRVQLERVERVHAAPASPRLAISAAPAVVPSWNWPRRSRRLVLGGVAVVIVAIGAGLTVPIARDWMQAGSSTERLAVPIVPERMSVLSSSDVALIRARRLYGRGRLAQALQALDRVDDQSPIRPEADALRVEIQRLLLASGREQSSVRPPSGNITR